MSRPTTGVLRGTSLCVALLTLVACTSGQPTTRQVASQEGSAPTSVAVSPPPPPACPPTECRWLQTWGGPGLAKGEATSIALAPDQKTIFVAGPTMAPGSRVGTLDFVAYPATGSDPLWEAHLSPQGSRSRGYEGATIVAGARRIYATSYLIHRGVQAVALDATDGAVQWQSDLPAMCEQQSPSIALDRRERRLYFACAGPIALNTRTGAEVWRSSPPRRGAWSTAMTLTPDGRTVATTGGAPAKGGTSDWITAAYDAASGRTEWIQNRRPKPRAGPSGGRAIVTSVDGSAIVVAGQDSLRALVVALDPATGAERWSTALPGEGFGSTVSELAATTRAVVAAGVGDSDTSADPFVAAVDLAGHPIWSSPLVKELPHDTWYLHVLGLAIADGGREIAVTGEAKRVSYTLGLDGSSGASAWVRTIPDTGLTDLVGARRDFFVTGGYGAHIPAFLTADLPAT